MNVAVYDELAEVAIVNNVHFDKLLINKYLELFKERQDEGYINNENKFFDNSWMITINGVKQSLIFPKKIVMKKMSTIFNMNLSDIDLAYRSFLLYNMPKNLKTNDINRLIIRFMNGKKEYSGLAIYVLSFLNYLNINEDIYNFYEDIIEDMLENKISYASRILPKFEDIFLFSDIINHIIESNSLIMYKPYLLTLMWWKIVSLIPLRPSEFLKIEFNCIYSENGCFYFKVKRAVKGRKNNIKRNTSKIDDCYKDDLIKIDENTYNLISKYKEILVSELNYDKEVELFPREILINSGYYQNISISISKRLNNHIILPYELKDNINKFYEDVVYKEYGIRSISVFENRTDESDCIGRLKPYDARHIAIMNLILMGNDPLTVMELAGHEDINTTFGYYNHVETFAEGYAISYAKKVKFKNKYEKMDESLYKNNLIRKIGFDDVMKELSGARVESIKVKGGYCYYPKFKTDKSLCIFYEGQHTLCKYFKADNKEILLAEIEKKKEELMSDVRTLVDLARDSNNISKFNELYRVTGYRIQNNMNDIKNIDLRLEDDN